MSNQENSKPGVKLPEEEKSKLKDLGITESEIRIIEVFRHVHYGHIQIHKKAGELDGRIEFRETY